MISCRIMVIAPRGRHTDPLIQSSRARPNHRRPHRFSLLLPSTPGATMRPACSYSSPDDRAQQIFALYFARQRPRYTSTTIYMAQSEPHGQSRSYTSLCTISELELRTTLERLEALGQCSRPCAMATQLAGLGLNLGGWNAANCFWSRTAFAMHSWLSGAPTARCAGVSLVPNTDATSLGS